MKHLIDYSKPLFIKSKNDFRKRKEWLLVTELQWISHAYCWIVRTDRCGWEKLQGCKIKQK